MNTTMNIIARFARYGVLHRNEVKNDIDAIASLIRQGFARKAFKSGRVFYELTEAALPLLEHQRRKLFEDAQMMGRCKPKDSLYAALIRDIRFLDEGRLEAKGFLFLGDWQINRPVVAAQLELSRLRFYEQRVPKRIRRKRAA